jgi:hypothetical protein
MKQPLLAGIALLAIGGLARALEPGPYQEFSIPPQVGPWTICAASFSGPMAPETAHSLVLELRNKYRLPAYLFNRGAELRLEQEEELQRKRQQQKEYLERMGLKPDMPLRLPRVRIEDQYAVLVGGFADMDAARRELARIKKMAPPASVPTTAFRLGTTEAAANVTDRSSTVSPFVNSFVVRNPAIPVVHEPTNKPDPFWKELNAGESYSLLKCPKPWTLAIKEYHGTAIIQPQSAPTSFMEKLFGNRLSQELDATAHNAHQLAEALHKMGLEAYVLHTRNASVVTVGSFDSPDDPGMNQVRRTLENMKFEPPIEFMPNLMPMEVPRLDNVSSNR